MNNALVRACLLRYQSAELLLVPNAASILLIDSATHELVDTLHGHQSPVKCIDASETGIVVSLSTEVCFHSAQNSAQLKWSLTFKTQMQGNLAATVVKLSSIGDLCILAGSQYVSVWAQDSSLESYTQQIFYTSQADILKEQLCQVPLILTTLTSIIKQVEISGDGRLFVTLEQDRNHLKVWHQNILRAAPDSELKIRRFYFEELQVYQTDESVHKLESFRIKYKSPAAFIAEPCVILTKSKFEIQVFVESLMDQEMRFTCIKTVKLSPRLPNVDALFLESRCYEPPSLQFNKIESHHLSRLFDSYRDEELISKYKNNSCRFGSRQTYAESRAGLQPGLQATDLVEFIVMEDSVAVSLYRIAGFSNDPPRNYSVQLVQRSTVDVGVSFKNVIACIQPAVGQHHQHDQMLLVTQNEQGHIYNLNLKKANLQTSLRNSYCLYASQATVSFTRNNKDLNLLAIVYADQVAVYHQSSRLYGRALCSQKIIDLSWVQTLNQFILLQTHENHNTVSLMSSQWMLMKERWEDAPNTQIFDTYKKLHSVQVASTAIAVQIVGAEIRDDDSISLHFACIHSHGIIQQFLFNYFLTVDSKVDVIQLQQVDFKYSASKSCSLVTSQQTQGDSYCLLLTEEKLGGKAQKIEQSLVLLQLFPHKTEIVFDKIIQVQHPVTAKIAEGFLVISIVEGTFHKYKYCLYIYNIKDQTFKGYLQLSDLLQLKPMQGLATAVMDFEIGAEGKSIRVVADDQVYLLIERHSRWSLATQHQFQPMIHSSVDIIGELAVLSNKFIVTIAQIQPEPFQSLPLYHPDLLRTYLFKGYAKQVAQILVLVEMHLSDSSNPLPELAEINFQAEKPAAEVKKPFNAFADFDEESEEEDIFQKKEEVVADFNQKFLHRFDSLVDALQTDCPLKLQKTELLQLIEFVFKFKVLFKTDFYCDKLATHLLFSVFFDTEKVSDLNINNAKISLALIEGIKTTLQESAGGLNMEKFIADRMGQASQKSEVDKSKVTAWTSAQVCMALYSENQDVVLDQLSQRLDFESSLTWGMMRKLGIPLWLKSGAKLKSLVELVAKNEYRLFDPDGHQTKPEYAALWYVLIGKIQVIKQLFNVEKDGKRFADFLSSDFGQEKPRTIAGKNAMALVSKRKNTLACSFYLLAQDLKNAVQIALERCDDPMLALLMSRMADPQDEQKQLQLIAQDHYLQKGTKFNDPYLRSLGQWHMGQYVKAVNELSPQKISAIESMFRPTKEFDLAFSKDQLNEEAPASASEESFPAVCVTSYEGLEMFARLQKVPEVKRQLKKDWQLDKKSKAGGGMFNDLMGSDEESEEEQVVEENETITVDETVLLERILTGLLSKGQTLLAQLLIQENQTASGKLSDSLKQEIAALQLSDLMQQEKVNTELIQASVLQLSHQLNIGIDMEFVSNQFRRIPDKFQVEIQFLHQALSPQKLIHSRILLQARSLIQFINLSAQYCGRLHQADDRSERGSKILEKSCNQIKEILETLMIVSIAPTQVIQFAKVEQKVITKAQTSQVKQNSGWFEEEEDEDSQSQQLEEALPNAPLNSQLSKGTKMRTSDLLSELTFRCQMGVLLSASLFQLSLVSAKFSLLAEIHTLLIQFLSVWNWSAQPVASEQQLQQNLDRLKFSELLELLKRLQRTIKRNSEHARGEHTYRRKHRNYSHIEQWQTYDFLASQFKLSACVTLFDDIFHHAIRILGSNKPAPQTLFGKKNPTVQQREESGFMPSDLVKLLDEEFRSYENEAALLFQHSCTQEQRVAVLKILESAVSDRMLLRESQKVDLRYFIKSEQKIKTFISTFNLKKYLPQLLDLHLSQTKLKYESVDSGQWTDSGIELFRQRGESVADICLQGDTIVIALQGKGMREINITCSLLFRNRTNQYDLVDEELFTWFDCLHRFDQHLLIQWSEPTQEPLRQALLAHQQKDKLSSITLQRAAVPIGREAKEWDGRPESDYCRQASQQEITHDDFTSAICAHPCLPLYFSGSAKGVVYVWQFNQKTNRCLNQWVLEPDSPLKDTNPKKQTVKKIVFSHFGDRFLSLNLEGTLFLHSFDLKEDKSALFIAKNLKISDFQPLDTDATLVVAISTQNKTLSVIDCLTGDTLAQSKTVGNLVQVDQERQCIYTFNQKSGAMQKHDLNLQLLLTKQLHKEDVTASAWCGHRMSSLMLGFSDGTIRVYEMRGDERDWEPKQTIQAFVQGKRAAVTSLKVDRESGIVYGASSLGSVKIIRLNL